MIKLGIVMDPIERIDVKKDSSFAILLEAQRRGYQLYYMETSDLYLSNEEGRATARIINIKNNGDKWYKIDSEIDLRLADLDVILMRKNPPFTTNYMYCTYILEHAEEKGTLIINKPRSLRDCNEKLYTTWFSKFIPITLVTSVKEKLKAFLQRNNDIILKPLDGMGGASVFRIKNGDPNSNVIIESVTNFGTRFCIAQKYEPAISNGDKRILIIDGKPIPYCLARIPKSGETRGNLAAGARGEVRPLTENDMKIAYCLGPVLKAKGLIFVGIDVIGDRLTEINVTSPTCIQEIEKKIPISISGLLMEAIEKRLRYNFN